MEKEQTFFDWEDSFQDLENITTDIYVSGTLKISDAHFDKIHTYRGESGLLNIDFFTKNKFYSKLIKDIKNPYALEVKLVLKFPHYTTYKEIIIYEANCINVETSILKDYVRTHFTSRKIKYLSDRENEILKEWYGCSNKLHFYKGFRNFKDIDKKTTYRMSRRISYKLYDNCHSTIGNSFWIKLDNYKFKVSVLNSRNHDSEYCKYELEYREKWGLIPNEDIRFDISIFLSFIIGAKLIKFGESYFSDEFISQKEYLTPTPIDTSFLYLNGGVFYNEDYRQNDTDEIIKQIPKMLRNYLHLKEKYRLDEVLPALYIKSYLNFNFISYITYIEMFANIETDQKSTVISKSKFKEILNKLNKVKGVPKRIRDKFQHLNIIGIGKKVKRLLSKYKIDYSEYKYAFDIRGKVVHGAYVDIKDMYVASEKAKELLTILTLKKLKYSGYIRNFTNNDELILLKDMSRKALYP